MLKGKNIGKMNETIEVREVEEFERLRELNWNDNWNENVKYWLDLDELFNEYLSISTITIRNIRNILPK